MSLCNLEVVAVLPNAPLLIAQLPEHPVPADFWDSWNTSSQGRNES